MISCACSVKITYSNYTWVLLQTNNPIILAYSSIYRSYKHFYRKWEKEYCNKSNNFLKELSLFIDGFLWIDFLFLNLSWLVFIGWFLLVDFQYYPRILSVVVNQGSRTGSGRYLTSRRQGQWQDSSGEAIRLWRFLWKWPMCSDLEALCDSDASRPICHYIL